MNEFVVKNGLSIPSIPNGCNLAMCNGIVVGTAASTAPIIIVDTGCNSSIRCGVNNTASGAYSSALGGRCNTASANYSSVFGCGLTNNQPFTLMSNNFVIGDFQSGYNGCLLALDSNGKMCTRTIPTPPTSPMVVGSACCSIKGNGCNNTVCGCFGFIGNGFCNTVCQGADCASILNGCLNINCAPASTIAGGENNIILSGTSIIGAGFCNTAGTLATGQIGILAGRLNTSTGQESFIGAGRCNTASGYQSLVVGGLVNTNSGIRAGIVSGSGNTISACLSFIGGGATNTISAIYATITGGRVNTIAASSCSAFIGGGSNNTICGSFGTNSVIAGGSTNLINGGGGSFIGAGSCNTIYCGGSQIIVGGNLNTTCTCGFSTIVGGLCNTSSGYNALVARGFCNVVSGCTSAVLSGRQNCATNLVSAVVSGCLNIASGSTSFIGNGILNTSSAACTAVVNGRCNTVNQAFGTIVGGCINTVSGVGGFVAAGGGNTASGTFSSIINGTIQTASGANSFIGSGACNTSSGICGFIGAGFKNTNQAIVGFVGGGNCNFACNSTSGCLSYGAVVGGGVGNNTTGGTWNLASCAFTAVAPTACNAGIYSTIGGGFQNMALGANAVILGGDKNTASGACSGILGGISNNTCGFATAMIVGSNLNATQACTTFTNCVAADNLTVGSGVCVGTNKVLVNYSYPFVTSNYGQFSQSGTLTATIVDTEYLMQFNTTKISSGVSIVSNSQITMANAGVYKIQFSAVVLESGGGSADVSIWFKKNGTPIANSNSTFKVKNNENLIAAWDYLESFTAGQYIEIAWSSNAPGTQLVALGTQLTPARPETPSVIVTVTRIS